MLELKMPDLNSVLIAGNLTNDPSFRQTTNGTPVANFYIASNRKFKDNYGQWRENVCYVGVVAWYKLAETCHENLKKGSAVLIEGELQSRIWKNEDGTNKNVVEIKARRIQFLNKQHRKEVALFLEESQDVEGEAKLEMSEEQPISSEISEDTKSENPELKSVSESNQEISNASKFNFGYEDFNLDQ
jgi:single-strand DNA-binding protein